MSPINDTDVLAVTRPGVGSFRAPAQTLKNYIGFSGDAYVRKTGDTMTGDLIVNHPTALVKVRPTTAGAGGFLVEDPGRKWYGALHHRPEDGQTVLYGSHGVRIATDAPPLIIDPGWRGTEDTYAFHENFGQFNRPLIIQRHTAGPAVEVWADVQAGNNARAQVVFGKRNGGQQWATIEARDFRTDYTGRDQCWLRAGTEVTGGQLYLSGGATSGAPVIFLNGATARCYIDSAGNLVKAVYYAAEVAAQAQVMARPAGPPGGRVDGLKPYRVKGKDGQVRTGFTVESLQEFAPEAIESLTMTNPETGEEETGTFASDSAILCLLVEAVQELSQRVQQLEGAN